MGRPLAHVPDPAGDGHDSYARHFAGLFLDTFERLGVRPDRVYWMSEVYAAGEMDRFIRVALDRADDRARHLPPRGQRPPSRRVAPAVGHLRELRPDWDHHRHRLGRGAGPLRVPPRPGGLGHRLRPCRRRVALRRPRQAAVQRRLGGEVEPVRRDHRAERQGSRHQGRRPRPLGGDRPRGVRARAAAERGLRVPEHRRPQDVDLQGAWRRRASHRRGAAAGAAAPPLPAAALQPGHRLRSGRDRCDPAHLRRVRPHRRRGGRARGEGRAAGRPGSAVRRQPGRSAGRCRPRPRRPTAHRSPTWPCCSRSRAWIPAPPSRSRRERRSPPTSSACSHERADAARAWLENYAPDSARIEVQEAAAAGGPPS